MNYWLDRNRVGTLLHYTFEVVGVTVEIEVESPSVFKSSDLVQFMSKDSVCNHFTFAPSVYSIAAQSRWDGVLRVYQKGTLREEWSIPQFSVAGFTYTQDFITLSWRSYLAIRSVFAKSIQSKYFPCK